MLASPVVSAFILVGLRYVYTIYYFKSKRGFDSSADLAGVCRRDVDAKAAYSHQKISRHQLPIAPDFERTAYSMQGFTLPAGKIDLNLGVNADAVTAYVAMSRFKTANDLIILQPLTYRRFSRGCLGSQLSF